MLPIIQDLTTVNYSRGNSGRKYIVIHYTGNKTDTARGNANYFRNASRGASAHYFVDITSIVQVVSDNNTSWAVGRNYGSNNLFGKCTNYNSISIEMCSNGGVIADSTFKNTVELTKYLMKKYGIPASNVVRHYDVCSKLCPGWSGWLPPNETIWNRFKAEISTDSTKQIANNTKQVSDNTKEILKEEIPMQGVITQPNKTAIYYYNIESKVMYHVPNPTALALLKSEYKKKYNKDIVSLDSKNFDTLKSLIKGKSI